MQVQFQSLTPVAFAAVLTLAGCSGGSSSNGVAGGDFVVLRTEPVNNGKLFLNEAIRIDFSKDVDLDSADLNTVSFQVLDQNGNPLSEQPAGTFRIGTTPGDGEPGRRLEFVPRFPTNDTFDNGGFRPGRTYVVQLVGGDERKETVLQDMGGKGLRTPVSFQFSTADGTTPAQLFRDTKPGGPRRVGVDVSPGGSLSAALNLLGRRSLEIRLQFDQPLNPDSRNVPVKLNNDPPLRDITERGRIFLEYDDPDPDRGRNSWIPADVDLEVNSLDGAEVVLRPVGVLPNNAEIRVIVENTLEDMAGESNVSDASYNRVFTQFITQDVSQQDPALRGRYQPLFDAVVENFDASELVDLGAPFLEPQAELLPGAVRANFAFEGANTPLDFEPSVREVRLDTVFTQVTPKNGPPVNVSGGVFEFRNVRIPQGVTVRGTGPNPMVWLVTGDFLVEGDLNVDGGKGNRVDTLNSANFPTAGGVGVCGGGAGGKGSPSAISRSGRGEAGFGPGQLPGGGGQGGRLDCTGCSGGSASRDGGGSGGGGGSLSTQGDPWFKFKAEGPISFREQIGGGGYGCRGLSGATSRTLPGGDPAPIPFKDSRTDNNFWGSAVNVHRQIRIVGELDMPIGGSGGGGGGDRSTSCTLSAGNFTTDNKGGGGGGGAGVLIIKALGKIEVAVSGRIGAVGGDGGGGEQAGSNSQGGGGGGGAGGMVILMAGERIVLHAHGGTYGDDPSTQDNDSDYNFVLSADGGIGLQGGFGGFQGQIPNPINDKYPPPNDTRWDDQPAGGFGGMGVIQLMAPTGNNEDGTNTVLDDGIDIVKDGIPLSGAEKQRYLAWRGFANEQGTLVDDSGVEIVIGDEEGDIRPAPLLFPAPFGQRSRARSRWIDTGASNRRPLDFPDAEARGVVEDTANGFLNGPTYEFTGTISEAGDTQGFADYVNTGTGTVQVRYPAVLPGEASIISVNPTATFDGELAYEVQLSPTGPGLGSIPDRYAQYRAELISDTGTSQGAGVLAEFRILHHTDRFLVLSPESGLLPPHTSQDPDNGAARLQILAKFFDVVTNDVSGLGPSYGPDSSGRTLPQANVRIGFAFHQDATRALADGDDPLRMPMRVGTFLYDLGDPTTVEAVRDFHAPYVQWDLIFETRFKADPLDPVEPAGLSPSTPLPMINYLVIPYRF